MNMVPTAVLRGSRSHRLCLRERGGWAALSITALAIGCYSLAAQAPLQPPGHSRGIAVRMPGGWMSMLRVWDAKACWEPEGSGPSRAQRVVEVLPEVEA